VAFEVVWADRLTSDPRHWKRLPITLGQDHDPQWIIASCAAQSARLLLLGVSVPRQIW
jgi:hypothetical protein